jgi:hypothetical protein
MMRQLEFTQNTLVFGMVKMHRLSMERVSIMQFGSTEGLIHMTGSFTTMRV